MWRRAVGNFSRIGGLAVLATALGAWVLVGAPGAAAQVPILDIVVATQEMSNLSSGARWVVRNDHQTNTEHTHSGGFVYVMNGQSTLKIEGEEIQLQEGQGFWVPEGVPHTHTADGSVKLWSFNLEQVLDPNLPQPAFVSKELVGYVEGPHLARLVADDYQVGATTPLHRHYGPEVVYVRDGQYELNYAGTPQSYEPGQGYMVEPLTPHRLRNAGQSVARLFGLSLIPLGRATSESINQ
jgi:quercetin dioxygenase-like cupin family protein